jgi:signal transduction histidine kinase
MAYDIVKEYGGEIQVITKENERTGFTISLPT